MEFGAPDMLTLEQKRKRFDRGMIVLAVLVIFGLTILQTRVVRWGAGVPTAHSILVFVLINVNIILLFLLLVLVLRNLYKVFFEQRQVMGAQLRTKLVVAFVSLSLLPTLLLFYAAIQFVTTGQEYWFEENVEASLKESLVLAQYMADVNEKYALDFGENIKVHLMKHKLYQPGAEADLEKYLREKRRDYNLALVEFYSPKRESLVRVKAPDLQSASIVRLPPRLFRDALTHNAPRSIVESRSDHDVVRVLWPLATPQEGPVGFMAVSYESAAPLTVKMKDVTEGLDGYLNLKKMKNPIKVSSYIALTIVALLCIFISTWIAFHLAKSITGPIQELAEGTERIAQGHYDFTIQAGPREGEIATLVDSFNHMTRDLKAGKTALEETNRELRESNTELEHRRKYMEIVLQSVAAGVIASDADGIITTVNRSAAEILKLPPGRILGRRLEEIIEADNEPVLHDLIRTARTSMRGAAEKHIRVKIEGQVVSLNLHLAQLKDEEGGDLGQVLVFDDLSDLEKAQRMAAWREVARRIAHEIKNPLTPIQLSAQRLRRRYGDRFGEDEQLFDECTSMIVQQVEELKFLVNEFSNFARMPEANPTLNALDELVEETLVLYQEGHKDVDFSFQSDPHLPPFNLDRDQMKRVLINLLDNAVAAVGEKGRVEVTLTFDSMLRMARLEVADNGQGIRPEDKRRMFEPYFSTKKSGTGLGLAIVSTVVADHDGFVRVLDNQPRGARFVIELPVRS